MSVPAPLNAVDIAGKTIATVTSVDVTATNNAEDHISLARLTLTFTDGTSVTIDEYTGDYWEDDESGE